MSRPIKPDSLRILARKIGVCINAARGIRAVIDTTKISPAAETVLRNSYAPFKKSKNRPKPRSPR